MTPKACNQRESAQLLLQLCFTPSPGHCPCVSETPGLEATRSICFYCFLHLCLWAREQRGHCAQLFGAEVPSYVGQQEYL